MSDESSPPKPQALNPPNPLEYFYPDGTPPLHPALLALSAMGGMVVGFGAMSVVVVAAALLIIWNNLRDDQTLIGFGLILLVLGVGLAGLLIRKIYIRRMLPIERRQRGPWYFFIGFLVGCCGLCLIAGALFAAIANDG